MDKYEFINLMLKNRNLSVNQKRRLILLATKELEAGDTGETKQSSESDKDKVGKHFPKDTAKFLSLFSNPNGFKFLTHNFDPDSDMSFTTLVENSRNIFKKQSKELKIPQNLYALMHCFLYGIDSKGKKAWMAFDGSYQNENYASDSWRTWAEKKSSLHPIANKDFEKTIMLFRSTIRVVKPALLSIVEELEKKHSDLHITKRDLEKADFYTYVHVLKDAIDRILADMSQYEHKDVEINYERVFSNTDDYSLRKIRITQLGSYSYSFDDVKAKFEGKGGGAFREIKNCLTGYCNWAVETKWDGKPLRWNILDDTGINETEEIDSTSVKGFTHILTFYYKA